MCWVVLRLFVFLSSQHLLILLLLVFVFIFDVALLVLGPFSKFNLFRFTFFFLERGKDQEILFHLRVQRNGENEGFRMLYVFWFSRRRDAECKWHSEYNNLSLQFCGFMFSLWYRFCSWDPLFRILN